MASTVVLDTLSSDSEMSYCSAEPYIVLGNGVIASIITSDDLIGHGCTTCDCEGNASCTAE